MNRYKPFSNYSNKYETVCQMLRLPRTIVVKLRVHHNMLDNVSRSLLDSAPLRMLVNFDIISSSCF